MIGQRRGRYGIIPAGWAADQLMNTLARLPTTASPGTVSQPPAFQNVTNAAAFQANVIEPVMAPTPQPRTQRANQNRPMGPKAPHNPNNRPAGPSTSKYPEGTVRGDMAAGRAPGTPTRQETHSANPPPPQPPPPPTQPQPQPQPAPPTQPAPTAAPPPVPPPPVPVADTAPTEHPWYWDQPFDPNAVPGVFPALTAYGPAQEQPAQTGLTSTQKAAGGVGLLVLLALGGYAATRKRSSR